jgi:CheY-like chemotaxis protein
VADAGGTPLRILLVEDNPEVADVAMALLEERGHTVARANCVDAAIEMLSADHAFDLVFSDLVMPGTQDGLDLARIVRRRWPGLPVLLATGYSEAANRAAEEGFRLLTKPYQPETLVGAIRQTLDAHEERPAASNVVALARK